MNRFYGVPWFLVETDGVYRALHEGFTPLTPYNFSMESGRVYEVVEEEPLDWISFVELDDSRKWKLIAEINWPDTAEPLEMETGVMLYLPPMEETSI